MKILLLRCTLALIMCGASASAWADDDVIINESFSNITSIGYNSTSYGDWTIFSCYWAQSANSNSPAIRLTFSSSNQYGYATSKEFEYSGDVELSFSYAKVVSSNSSFRVIINNGGVFDNYQTSKTYDVLGTKDLYKPITLNIIGTTRNTTITFILNSEQPVGIDDVIVRKMGYTLDQSLNNNDFYIANNEKTIDVNTTRTLTGSIWNTMCLPFDVTMDDLVLALGDNQDIRLRTYSSYDTTQKIMYFEEVDNNATIIAGTPFLIKLNTTVVNPTFHVVTIKNTAASSVTHNSVSFVGTYSPVDLNIDGTHLFITTDGTVAKPGDDTQNHLKGLRAYIEVPSGTTTPSRLNIDDETVDIQQIDSDNDYSTVVYDLKGLRLERPKKGLCIKDGKLIFIK